MSKKRKEQEIPDLPVLEIIERTIGEANTIKESWCTLDSSWGKDAGFYRVQLNDDIVTIRKVDVNALLEIDNVLSRINNGESGFEITTDYNQQIWEFKRTPRNKNK